ncbi:MAG: CPBP family intramembrane metalloprotease [Atopobiaceae bacterium]|nr:CPBP family intramembrane metalloprotease [Atopobiaceae bacterium]
MNSFSSKHPVIFGIILIVAALFVTGVLTALMTVVGLSTEGGTVIGRIIVAAVLILLFHACFHWDKSFSGIALAWPALIVVAWNIVYHLMEGAGFVAASAIPGAILAGLAPGLFEEVIFRGIIIDRMRASGKSVWYSLIVSALLFALVHLTNIVGMSLANVLVQVAYSLVIGLFLGAVYLASDDIAAVILAHASIDISNQVFATSPNVSSAVMVVVFLVVLVVLAVYALMLARKTAAEER